MSKPLEFFAAVAPTALLIASRTTMKPETLMCQFANETGWHSEGTWQGNAGWRGKNNLAGISPNGEIGDYASLSDFAEAYVSVITQDAFGFPEVLAEKDLQRQCIALGRSQWAGSRYDSNSTGRPGVDLTDILRNYGDMIEDALNYARGTWKAPVAVYDGPATPDLVPEPIVPPSVEDCLNDALRGLGKAYEADEQGREVYHAMAAFIRQYASTRGMNGVTVGA